MGVVLTTEPFDIWYANLRDLQIRSRVLARIRRAELGNLGDWKAVGEGVREMRIPCGPGIRVYFLEWRGGIVVLLAGGDKSTQEGDIACAKALAKTMKNMPAAGSD